MLSKNPSARFFPKNIWVNFNPLCCCNFMKKKFHALLFHKTWKTLTLGLFRPTNLTKFFPKIILFNFKPLCCCNFTQKKIRKVTCIDFSQNLKNLICGSIFGPFWPKNFKRKFFPQKSYASFLSLWDAIASCKNSKTFYDNTDFW